MNLKFRLWPAFQHAYLQLLVIVVVSLLVETVSAPRISGSPTDVRPITIATPFRVAGYSGIGDARDIDLYPDVAYQAATQRYLVVWLSLHNASSRSDGFDVYGIFLNQSAQPIGGPFRISDANTAARSSSPSVAAGDNGFVVAWAKRGSPCRLAVQKVVDATTRPDQVLNFESNLHQHSPRIVYNVEQQRFVLAFVLGDDYLPPTLAGGDASDCGDNPTSTSQIRVVELSFVNDKPVLEFPLTVSEAQGGAFRPALAYSAALKKYLVVWEDRRGTAGEPYLFDVYAQRLDRDLTAAGTNFTLSSGNKYINSDTSATWTPRPAVAASDTNFFTTWFEREGSNNSTTWYVQGQLIAATGESPAKFKLAETTFVNPPANRAPSGFLDTVYQTAAQEFLVAISSHTESVFGYSSSIRVQRLSSTGQLLKLDGNAQSTSDTGSAIDYTNDDQVSVAIAANGASNGDTGYALSYGKHALNQHAQDFDIWSSGAVVAGFARIYLPLIMVNSPPALLLFPTPIASLATATSSVNQVPTATPVPPTSTFTPIAPTATPMPPTATNTPVAPTATPMPPTLTNTPIPNSSPVANNQNVTTSQNMGKNITLTASDANDDPLTYIVVSNPINGILNGTPPNLVYTPNASFSGADVFTFKATDGKAVSNIATINITVGSAPNTPPTAFNQNIITARNQPVGITLTASDTENNSLTYSIISTPAHGMLSGVSRSLTYTPAAGFAGNDGFTFKANDGKADSNIATITITVIANNTPPIATNQNLTTIQNTAKDITLTASDADNDPLVYMIVSNVNHGTLSGTSPNLSYIPDADFSGSDSLIFKVNDGQADSNIATVNITVAPAVQAPVAPSNLEAIALDANDVQLNWIDNANNENGFAIYDGDTFVATVGTNTTIYTVNELMPDSYHCYHLFAFNDYSNSAWTDWGCATTPPAVTVQFYSAAFNVTEDSGTATITVILSTASGQTVAINYAISDDTATAGRDYGLTNGTLTFDPGQTSATFTFPIFDDSLNEGDETVNLLLSNPSNASLDFPATATLTIIDSYPACWRKPDGDANCDDLIDLLDYEIWRQEANEELTTKTADFNGDGVVDISDFNIWQANYPS